MNIKVATYVDHQKEINYPIDFLKSVNPALIVYCSDENNQLNEDWRIIGKSIKEPNDISIAQNECIDDLFNHGADFVVWQQADVYISKIGQGILDEFCKIKNLNETLSLRTTMFRLFHHCGWTDFGVNAIGKEAWKATRNKFTGDGAYLGTAGAETNPTLDAAIDIGYLTIEQCRNHIKRHKITWQAKDDIIDLSDNEFIKAFVKRHNVKGIVSQNSEYYKLFCRMGFEREYHKIKEII